MDRPAKPLSCEMRSSTPSDGCAVHPLSASKSSSTRLCVPDEDGMTIHGDASAGGTAGAEALDAEPVQAARRRTASTVARPAPRPLRSLRLAPPPKTPGGG